MTDLERRYRALLRVLPRWYRAQREEEMVATFMAHRRDPNDRELGWPGRREFWAVLALAGSTRITAQHGSPRAVVLGDVVRLAALLILLAQVPRTVASTADLAASPVFVLRLDYVYYYLVTAAYLSTTITLIALLGGRPRLARVCAAVAVATSLVAVVLSALPVAFEYGLGRPGPAVALFSSVWVAIACVVVGFTREAPAPPVRPWSLAAGCIALLTVVWMAIRDTIGNGYWLPVLGDLGSSSGWMVIVAAAVLPFVGRRLGSSVGRWALALAIVAAALVPDRLSYLQIARQIDVFDGVRGPLVATSIQAALLATVAAVLGSVGVYTYRRLPAPATGASAA